MTIVAAGYQRSSITGNVSGIYVASDSLLSGVSPATGKREPIIENYRKIFSVPLILKKPYFDNEGYFVRYLESFRSSCLVAFAGSSLTFTHFHNDLNAHLSDLRLTFTREFGYEIVIPCSSKAIKKGNGRWADDIVFEGKNVPDISGRLVIETLVHVFSGRIVDISRHQLKDEQSFKRISCELLLGVYCYQRRKMELYHIGMHIDNSGGEPKPACSYRLIGDDEILVLGLKDEQAALEGAVAESRNEQEPDQRAVVSCLREIIQRRSDDFFVGGHVLTAYVDQAGCSFGFDDLV